MSRSILRIIRNLSTFLTILLSGTSIVAANENNYRKSFPYHPLTFHMDLSILSYQVYSQSLVWPFDPYYEELSASSGRRNNFMSKVITWAKAKGKEQVRNSAGLNSYRGPGSLGGFPDNTRLDPILYNYSRIFPVESSIANAYKRWTEYKTPKSITSAIGKTYVCYRPTGGKASSVAFEAVPAGNAKRGRNARDILLAFEGGTGDKGVRGQPASQSLMGVILARHKSNGSYDVHIAFRGSRSGSGARAALQANWDKAASGNPDWVTDLGYNRLGDRKKVGHVSTVGKIHRGFAQSMRSIHPKLFHCLDQLARLKKGAAPDNIYVTGHSLGGALAQAFVASVLIGNKYGPDGRGKAMQNRLRKWPWRNIKLVSFSAPRIGDKKFARTLTEDGLQSKFFTSILNPVDTKALRPNDSTIVPRLLDPNRPAGFRVLHSRDPITTQKGAGGKHVGKTVYVNAPRLKDLVSPPDVSAHEPAVVRKMMRDNLGDTKSPKSAFQYLPLKAFSPNHDKSRRSSIAELRKLAAAVRRYHSDRNIPFHHRAFEKEVELRAKLVGAN
ncbi:MAG: lipase family protein [Rhizobiaceae bacterium]